MNPHRLGTCKETHAVTETTYKLHRESMSKQYWTQVAAAVKLTVLLATSLCKIASEISRQSTAILHSLPFHDKYHSMSLFPHSQHFISDFLCRTSVNFSNSPYQWSILHHNISPSTLAAAHLLLVVPNMFWSDWIHLLHRYLLDNL